ncbi:MAG: thioredoxin family protein [Candidatus Margulisbacteria bacterium]|nr:thioredoxin family protein [Candidatus Margulisiibacteriota bacterium]
MALDNLAVKVFGKPGCEFCKTTVKKFETFMQRWEVDTEKVQLQFFDMETVDGLAEGAFYSVTKIPSTVIEKEGSIAARWDGKVPLSSEFKDYFGGVADSGEITDSIN